MIRSLSLTIARFALSAWVGAAVLFVITAVKEVRHFDSVTDDILAGLRFPSYYAVGFTLVATGLVFGWMAKGHAGLGTMRIRCALGLTCLTLLIMLVDYFAIYGPLEDMITPPGQNAKPASFQTYHRASMMINAIDISLCMIAALLFCWPGKPARPSDDPH